MSFIFFKLLLLNYLLTTACNPGKYDTESLHCKSCPVGYYQNEYDADQCKECLKGWFGPLPARDDCKPCPKGQYQDEKKKPICKKCQRGKENLEKGQTSCLFCELGKYQSEFCLQNIPPCNKKCKVCPSGYHGNNETKIKCSACPPGKHGVYHENLMTTVRMEIVQTSLTACKFCLPGRFSTGLTPKEPECTHCPKGRWSDESAMETEKGCKNCGKINLLL